MVLRCFRSMLGRSVLAVLCSTTLLNGALATPPEHAPLIDFQHPVLPTMGRTGMVSGPEPLATEAGLSMLKLGGNAVDAAVATGFALAVTLPRAGNLAGGGFMLIHLSDDNTQRFIDYREMAPAAATRDMFLADDGTVDRRKAYFSHQAAGIPGTPAGLLHALERYGTLDLATVIQPAIDLAENGFPMTIELNMTLNSRAERLAANAAARDAYLLGGDQAPPIGTLFKQPDLAATLKRIRDSGHEGFYGGKTADLIADDMAANDGLITREDLASYRAIEREPVRGQFRGYDIVSAPPPSSGGVHVIEMLNILEPYPLEQMGHNSAAYLHHLIGAMQLAYADRSEHLGDPDHSRIPIDTLTSKDYAEVRRALFNATRATPSTDIAAGSIPNPESTETTHFSVADRFGNVVANTYTLNFSYGSHIVVPGTGMLLNNEMDDFAARPGFANAYGLVQGEANAVGPGRRPLSSMTPTIVFKDGAPWLATGSPGGSLIINAVLQTLLNAMVFDMNVAAATAAPRVHHQWLPDTVRVEPGISPDTVHLLRNFGHNVDTAPRTIGRVNSIMLSDGLMFGYADLRRPRAHVAAE
jgi:gamma-glutamyltranspeptidase/glutathione hydrolase